MIMRWPKALSGSSKPKASGCSAPGSPSVRSNGKPANGFTGTIANGFTVPSSIQRPKRRRETSMQPCQALITSPDVLNKILPGKPGAVHGHHHRLWHRRGQAAVCRRPCLPTLQRCGRRPPRQTTAIWRSHCPKLRP